MQEAWQGVSLLPASVGRCLLVLRQVFSYCAKYQSHEYTMRLTPHILH